MVVRWGGGTLYTKAKAMMGGGRVSAFHVAPKAPTNMPTMHGYSPVPPTTLKAISHLHSSVLPPSHSPPFCYSLPHLNLFTLPGVLAFNKRKGLNVPKQGLPNSSFSGPQNTRSKISGRACWGPVGRDGVRGD